MTEHALRPRAGRRPRRGEEAKSSGVLVYTVGLLARRDPDGRRRSGRPTPRCCGDPASRWGCAVLAIAQMGVHLVFFLHITTGPDDTNNVLALAFGIFVVGLVVVFGSMLIMADLDATHARP